MLENKIIVFIALLFINLSALAGSYDHNNLVLRTATKESAIESAEQYYAHLNRGMTRQQLDYYWTDNKAEEFDALILRMAETTGKELVQESQRLMDLSHMESRCEERLLTKAKTYGVESKTAKLNYSVRHICASWKKPSYRTVTLKFSAGVKRWLIDKIEGEE
ncbi:MAG: hypothetical protein MI864_14950 [Pseudomonadales bacterium]|nr:hypothetical protein [Pseudomonadales bacterium]